MRKSTPFSFPEEYNRRQLNALYREIPLKDTTFRLLRKYFNAMANLYGIIPLRKAFEIIQSQNQDLISAEGFDAFAEVARHECEDYYILGKKDLFGVGENASILDCEIIDVSLLTNGLDVYLSVKEQQQNKPYYVPAKKELLAYDDMFFCEQTPAAIALQNFFSEAACLQGDQLQTAFLDICYGVRYMNAELPDILQHLEKLGISFKGKQEITIFAELYLDFHNQARLQCNRGHTPNELHAMFSQTRGSAMRSSFVQRGLVPIASHPTKQKQPGRNAPCPCGSGRKYKNCCGK